MGGRFPGADAATDDPGAGWSEDVRMTTLREQSTPADPRADEIVRDLEARRCFTAAERVTYLLSLDGDDPDEEPINVESAALVRRAVAAVLHAARSAHRRKA